jgi:leader peptidase (prepilin peptidase) / N-methyltransferase
MDLALATMIAAPGLAIGSFLNVVVARVPQRLAIGATRSACVHCGEAIAWSDNIPLVSYALLRGRCRGCHERISPLYPAVEFAAAALLVGAAAKFGFTLDAALAGAFCLVLVVLAAIDIGHRIVPNRIVVPAAAVALAAQTALHPSPEWALGAAGAFLFFLVAALVHPGGIGMGDVKLAALLGAVLGTNVVVGIAVGLLASIVPSFVLFALHGGKARKMAIPLVPFLAIGALAALFFGDALLGAYTGLYE